MSIPTDTALIFSCRHCADGFDLIPMIAHKDGRFVCRDCGHTVRPGLPEYKCACRPCVRAARREDAEEWKPS